MTSFLTVIALVVRLRVSNHTAFGDALYRNGDEVITFSYKQFVNSRNEYNQAFKEGDLVLFGGKFTFDQEKLLVSITSYSHIINHFNTIFYLPFYMRSACRRNGLYHGSENPSRRSDVRLGSTKNSSLQAISSYYHISIGSINYSGQYEFH